MQFPRGVKRALAACALAATLGAAGDARAVIVERIVAVVGDRPILLSELQRREHPFLVRVYAASNNPAQIAAAKTEMEKELLNRMIDDRLEEQAADKARLSVNAEEVDSAIKNVAANAHLTVQQLLDEAGKQGLSEQDYRDELRRQVLEGKLVQLRVRGRVRVTEEDARATYQRFVGEMEKQSPIDLHILALRLVPGASSAEVQARVKMANVIVDTARKPGADFCALVTQYSDDVQTKKTCGSRGPQPRAQIYPEIQAAIDGLKPGEVSEPVAVGTSAILIVQMGEDRVPTYDEVKEQMWERAYGEAMEHQRKLWLDELRHGVYVDPRL